MPALPAVVLGLVAACNVEGCIDLALLSPWPLPSASSFSTATLAARLRSFSASLPGLPRAGPPLYTHEAMIACFGWFLLTLLLHLLLPGKRVQGPPLADGSGRRLEYKLNAGSVFGLLYGAALLLSFGSDGALDLAWAADNFLPLATASVILSSGLAVVVYVASFLPPGEGGVEAIGEEGKKQEDDDAAPTPTTNRRRRRLLSAHGATGVPWYDFWMGRELNPRFTLSLIPVGTLTCPLLPQFVRNRLASLRRGVFAPQTVDLKEFCELYPGMIGWALLNLAFAFAQSRDAANFAAETGLASTPGSVLNLGISNAMLLVNLFELWYVADALVFNEQAILTTMDITTDGFGFMLSFGDLCWVPFTFATQARFLAEDSASLGGSLSEQALSNWALAGVLCVQALGYLIFRGANGQKNAFRRLGPGHPSVAHLKSMPTRRGTRLLVSGWWGLARHINYLGDWLMGLAWCLPTGLRGLRAAVPFFYAAYFASLLAHRERRDDAACLVKYGKEDWGKYCALVPWRIVPWVY